MTSYVEDNSSECFCLVRDEPNKMVYGDKFFLNLKS